MKRVGRSLELSRMKKVPTERGLDGSSGLYSHTGIYKG